MKLLASALTCCAAGFTMAPEVRRPYDKLDGDNSADYDHGWQLVLTMGAITHKGNYMDGDFDGAGADPQQFQHWR